MSGDIKLIFPVSWCALLASFWQLRNGLGSAVRGDAEWSRRLESWYHLTSLFYRALVCLIVVSVRLRCSALGGFCGSRFFIYANRLPEVHL